VGEETLTRSIIGDRIEPSCSATHLDGLPERGERRQPSTEKEGGKRIACVRTKLPVTGWESAGMMLSEGTVDSIALKSIPCAPTTIYRSSTDTHGPAGQVYQTTHHGRSALKTQ
jgi:hypothetical protein